MVFTIVVMIRVGLLGCGNIGHIIAKTGENIEIIALFDIIFDKARELADMRRWSRTTLSTPLSARILTMS